MELTRRMSPTTWNYWRIVLALAAKDIVDAIKNRTTLTILIGLGLVILTVQALPLLLKLDNRPRVAIYDAGRTGLADELRQDGSVQVSEMRTAEDARSMAPEASGPLLALTLPAGWQESSGALEIDGYLAHWIRSEKASQLVREVEAAITAAVSRPITIQTLSVYPTIENRGHTIMVASGLVLVAVMITAILVPNLILEEKAQHTLEVLQVSPATFNQILLGKGLAGFVYGVLAAVVLLAFNLAMVAQWGLMLTALISIILFGVGLGLVVGTIARNEGTVQMWVGLLAVLLLLPLMLIFVNSTRLPAWVLEVLAWLPTTASFDLIRFSFGREFPAVEVWSKIFASLAAVLLVFSIAGWRLRRWQV